MLKISDLEDYDENMTIKELKEIINRAYPFICPKCKGKGLIYKEDTNYDVGGSHVSGWIECDICQGYGRTQKQKKPICKIIGYE